MEKVVQHTAYDWCKDIIIPLTGAILIPVAIAFFTWWFGASRAEKQKELEKLRDNLNLLISMIGTNIVLLLKYRNAILTIIRDYKVANTNMDTSKIFHTILYDDSLRNIDCTKYANCIQYSENFVGNLIEIQNLSTQIEFLNSNRTSSLKTILEHENNEYRSLRLLDFLKDQDDSLQDSLNLVDLCIIKSGKFLEEIKSLEKKVKKLKLDRIACDDSSFFEQIKQEYNQRNEKSEKEPNK